MLLDRETEDVACLMQGNMIGTKGYPRREIAGCASCFQRGEKGQRTMVLLNGYSIPEPGPIPVLQHPADRRASSASRSSGGAPCA